MESFLISQEHMNTQQKPYTLKDIAQKLGVSSATISNAFNRPDQLSPALRKKIMKACEKLGYTGPNAAARSLRTGKTGIIGVYLADPIQYSFSDPVAAQFLQGVSEVAEAEGINILLFSNKHQGAQNYSVEAVPDGFILYGAPEEKETLNRIQLQRKPMVTVDFDLHDYASVHIDNEDSAYKIADYTLSHNPAKQVAILGLKLSKNKHLGEIEMADCYGANTSISKRRLDGYIKALTDHSITEYSIYSIPKNVASQSEIIAQQAIAQGAQILLCMSDRIALSAMNVARKNALQIPAEVCIVGFDGIDDGEHIYPGLTTMCQRSIDKGREAAKRLLNITEHAHLILPTDLIVRGSC